MSSLNKSNNDGTSNNLKVLNISNVNAQNEIVLNDEQLLILIQSYPFLYNPHVRPHGDADYENWAWTQIAKSFNRLYEKMERNVWYTSTDLMERWKELQPIVRTLAKSNVKYLPDSLRQTIVKITVPMDEKPNDSLKKAITVAQKTMIDYLPLVDKLSLEQKRCLEAEMMELILNSELESKATIKLWPADLETIEKECNEIIKELKLNELDMVDPEVDIHKENDEIGQINSQIINIETDIENQSLLIPKVEYDFENSKITKGIPICDWSKYVRKCRVRVKRILLEDDIPLAQIKREKKDFFLS